MSGSRLVLPSQQPVQATGLPYAGGQLFFYLTGTSTLTPTYADSALTTPNTNPVILDSAGNAGSVFLNPSIVYKVALFDVNNNLIWTYDPVYPFADAGVAQSITFAGTSTGTANAQILNGLSSFTNGQIIEWTAGFTNTGAMTLSAFQVYQVGPGGPQVLTGNEVQVGGTYFSIFLSALNSNAGGFQQTTSSLSFTQPPGTNNNENATTAFVTAAIPTQAVGGRLTLSSGVPVLSGAVSAAATIVYTPYVGSQIPVWNGTSWNVQSFAEISQALSDATHSPAAAVANTLYDMFVWVNAAVVTLSRGPAWSNATTRALSLSRINGILTNSGSITNGPAANFGVYVGTIATDSGAATVTFNPQPAAASAGPTGGAWLGLWNQYNRVPLAVQAQDSKASWAYAANTWRQADASVNNQITFISGNAEDSVITQYMCETLQSASGTNQPFIGIGLDSVTAVVIGGAGTQVNSSGSVTVSVQYAGAPVLGQHYFAAMEATSGSVTFYGVLNGGPSVGGGQSMQLSAQLKF